MPRSTIRYSTMVFTPQQRVGTVGAVDFGNGSVSQKVDNA
jgi:hypothetical protein